MHNCSWIVYKVFVIILMLTSFRAWMFWELEASVFFWIVSFCISIFFILLNRKHYLHNNRSRYVKWFVWLQLAVVITFIHSDLNFLGVIAGIVKIWCVLPVILLNKESKANLFDTVYKTISVVLSVSLIAWLLYLSGVPLSYDMQEYSDGLYYFQNYRFFLRNTTMGIDAFFPRFCSIFLEPGFLGCLISLLLISRKFKKDYWLIIMLIALFLTFSLAGWLITIIGFVLYKTVNARRIIVTVLSMGLALLAINYFARNYNEGDNAVNYLIFERLSFDANKTGNISGYDRSTEQTSDWFWNSFINSPDILFGSESSKTILEINDTDFIAYIIRYGIVGFLLFMAFTLYPFFSSSISNKRRRISLLVYSMTFFLIFLQTIHLIFSIMYLSVFILGESEILTQADALKKEKVQVGVKR